MFNYHTQAVKNMFFRIGAGTCNMIKNALKKNKSLRALSLAFNILTPENAHTLAEFMISKHAPPDFELLDMENVFVKKDFIPVFHLYRKCFCLENQKR